MPSRGYVSFIRMKRSLERKAAAAEDVRQRSLNVSLNVSTPLQKPTDSHLQMIGLVQHVYTQQNLYGFLYISRTEAHSSLYRVSTHSPYDSPPA